MYLLYNTLLLQGAVSYKHMLSSAWSKYAGTQASDCTFVTALVCLIVRIPVSHLPMTLWVPRWKASWWRFSSSPSAKGLALKRDSKVNSVSWWASSAEMQLHFWGQPVWAPCSEPSHVDGIRQTSGEEQGWIWTLWVMMCGCTDRGASPSLPCFSVPTTKWRVVDLW